MPRLSKAIAPLALALSAGWVAACDHVPAGATIVGKLEVSEGNLNSAPELGMNADQARAALQKALEATGRFAVREKRDDDRAARVRLEVEQARRVVAPPPTVNQGAAALDREQAEVVVSLELSAPNGKGDWDRLVAEGGARRPTGAEAGAGPDPEARRAAFEAALEGAAHEASTALAWQLESRRKTDAELLRDLNATDARLRDYAVRALAERRNPA
ncbi:MAG: hypothetical protein JST92_13490, partial [Deltaproteobacteria bacterium]|nr:hypothetical protein [Deltaproteobacteria bacterium]